MSKTSQKGGVNNSDYDLMYKILLTVMPYYGDQNGNGLSLLESIPNSFKSRLDVEGTNYQVRIKLLKTFQNFMKVFKVKTIKQLIDKFREVGRDSAADFLENLQSTSDGTLLKGQERTTKRKEIRGIVIPELREVGATLSTPDNKIVDIEDLQNIIKIPSTQGFWRLVSRSAKKVSPPREVEMGDLNIVDVVGEDAVNYTPDEVTIDDWEEITSQQIPLIESEIQLEQQQKQEQEEKLSSQAEQSSEKVKLVEPEVVETIPKPPGKLASLKNKFFSLVSRSSKTVPPEEDIQEDDDDMFGELQIDYSNTGAPKIVSSDGQQILISDEGTVEVDTTDAPSVEKREAKTRKESGSVFSKMKSGVKSVGSAAKSAVLGMMPKGSAPSASVSETFKDGKKYVKIEIIADKDMTVNVADKGGDSAEFYFDVMGREIEGEAA